MFEIKKTDSLELKKTGYFEESTKENKPSIEKSICSLIVTKKEQKKGHKQKFQKRNLCCEKTKKLQLL